MYFYVYHYRGNENDVPGIIAQGTGNDPRCRSPLYWLKIDSDIGQYLLDLTKKFDVMLCEERVFENCSDLPEGKNKFYSIHLDDKGKRFRQM